MRLTMPSLFDEPRIGDAREQEIQKALERLTTTLDLAVGERNYAAMLLLFDLLEREELTRVVIDGPGGLLLLDRNGLRTNLREPLEEPHA